MLRVLWLTNMWPDEQRPWYGSFVARQADSVRTAGAEVDVLYIPGYRGKAEYGRGARAMLRALRGGQFDLLHAHYGHCGAVACLQRRVPVVISYCGDDLLGTCRPGSSTATYVSRLAACGLAQLARVARATITKSAAMATRLPASARERNHVIPNGVDLRTFEPFDSTTARRQLGWSNARPNVLFVGKPDVPSKNFALARAVCDRLARQGRPVELRVAADVEPAAMPLWMNAADVMLFPSLSEGSPNSIKEAMAVELPIVSAPVGDVPERLEGVPGTFVVEHSIESMARALHAALQVGRAPAARLAVEQLSLERVARRVMSVYSSVTGEVK